MQNGFENQILVEPVARLIEEFGRLPGVGPKTASRLTFFLLRAPDEQARALADALTGLKENVVLCSRCFNITVSDPCVVCNSESRDQRTICVVEERGHVVLRASNGVNGLALARVAHPALIISDVMMPLLDGYALLRALRAEPELAQIAVVLASAGFPRHGEPQSTPPADAYLYKPFDITAIESILDRLT